MCELLVNISDYLETLVYEPGIILKDRTPCRSDDMIQEALYVWQNDSTNNFQIGARREV